jgi:hypothetical protein
VCWGRGRGEGLAVCGAWLTFINQDSVVKSSHDVGGNVTKENASPANIYVHEWPFSVHAGWASPFCLKLFLEPSLVIGIEFLALEFSIISIKNCTTTRVQTKSR